MIKTTTLDSKGEYWRVPADQVRIIVSLREAKLMREVEETKTLLNGYRSWLKKHVEPLRRLAMEISLKYEPCGYYCDPDEYGGGHHDHKLFNWAKFLYGDGIQSYTPENADELLKDSGQ